MFLEIMTGISTLAGLASADESADLQEQALSDQQAAEAASLAFQKEQYDRWKGIYGDLEENLGEFYQGLTPDYIAAQGLQEEQKAFQKTMTQVSESLKQMGVSEGAQADIMARAEIENAQAKAKIRAEAPYKTAELQQSFLALGAGGAEQYGQALETAAQTAGQTELALSQQAGAESADAFSAAGQFATLLGKQEADKTTAAENDSWID